ncbi:MAG: IS1096 element passenger TnpR family protein [Bacteroidia bacterium]
MQIIYKFRVHFEDHDDVVRFIDINSTSSFADFHKIIQDSIGFDASKAYTFHMSNDFWRTDTQICDSEPREESQLKLPKQTILNKFINDPHQRFIYMFDPDLIWTFYIELVKIQKAEPHKKYPLLARKEGEAPKQYKLKGKLPGATANLNEYDKMAEMLIASRLMDDLVKDVVEEEDMDEEEIEIEELDKEIPDIKIPDIIKPVVPRERVSFDLKFDDEELKIDADDLDFLEGEEGDEEKEDDEEDDLGFDDGGGYGSGDDNNDDY